VVQRHDVRTSHIVVRTKARCEERKIRFRLSRNSRNLHNGC
jgi:hypothetical protein